LESGELDRAQQSFEAVAVMPQGAADGLAGRGAILQAKGDVAAALKLLATAAATHGDSAVVQLWLGRAELAQGDLDAATRAFGRARSEDSTMLRAYEGLGDVYRRKGAIDSAIRQYEDALAKRPNAVGVRRRLAEVMVAQARFADAAPHLQAALAAAPEDGGLQVLRGLIAQSEGDVDGAVEALQKGLELGVEGEGRLLVVLAGLELQRGNHHRAIAHCEAAVQAGESRAELFSIWGLALFRLENYAAAAERLEQAVEAGSEDAFVHYNLGVLYMDYLGDAERALANLETYRRLGGSSERVLEWIAKLRG